MSEPEHIGSILSRVWDDIERRRIHAEANRKRSEAAKEQPRTADGTRLAEKQVVGQSVLPPEPKQEPGKQVKAAAAKVNMGAVANRKRSESQKGVPKDEAKERSGTKCPSTFEHKAREAKAGAAKVNMGAVANRKRSEAAKERTRTQGGMFEPEPVLQQSVAAVEEHPGQEARAAAAKVNMGTVELCHEPLDRRRRVLAAVGEYQRRRRA